jgi:hypothetical protein
VNRTTASLSANLHSSFAVLLSTELAALRQESAELRSTIGRHGTCAALPIHLSFLAKRVGFFFSGLLIALGNTIPPRYFSPLFFFSLDEGFAQRAGTLADKEDIKRVTACMQNLERRFDLLQQVLEHNHPNILSRLFP